MRKIQVGFICLAMWVFGGSVTHAAYLVSLDESDSGYELTVFDSDTGSTEETYIDFDDVVQASDDTFYAWASDESDTSSTLYQFVLNDDDSISTEVLQTYEGISDIESITIAGDTLYVWADYGEVGNESGATWNGNPGLYSVDLTDSSLSATLELSSWSSVELMTYDSVENVLYVAVYSDSSGFTVRYIDLDESSLSESWTAWVPVSDPEGLITDDEGNLYVYADSMLYLVDTAGSNWDISGFVVTDLETLSLYASASNSVPEPASALVWFLIAGGAGYAVRQRRSV